MTTIAGTGADGHVDGTFSSAQFATISGVALGPLGKIFVSERGNNYDIRVLDSSLGSGVVSTLAGCGESGLIDGVGVNALFMQPVGIAFDPIGSVLYVCDRDVHVIRAVTTAG